MSAKIRLPDREEAHKLQRHSRRHKIKYTEINKGAMPIKGGHIYILEQC